jgi:hypothetical protein
MEALSTSSRTSGRASLKASGREQQSGIWSVKSLGRQPQHLWACLHVHARVIGEFRARDESLSRLRRVSLDGGGTSSSERNALSSDDQSGDDATSSMALRSGARHCWTRRAKA